MNENLRKMIRAIINETLVNELNPKTYQSYIDKKQNQLRSKEDADYADEDKFNAYRDKLAAERPRDYWRDPEYSERSKERNARSTAQHKDWKKGQGHIDHAERRISIAKGETPYTTASGKSMDSYARNQWPELRGRDIAKAVRGKDMRGVEKAVYGDPKDLEMEETIHKAEFPPLGTEIPMGYVYHNGQVVKADNTPPEPPTELELSAKAERAEQRRKARQATLQKHGLGDLHGRVQAEKDKLAARGITKISDIVHEIVSQKLNELNPETYISYVDKRARKPDIAMDKDNWIPGSYHHEPEEPWGRYGATPASTDYEPNTFDPFGDVKLKRAADLYKKKTGEFIPTDFDDVEGPLPDPGSDEWFDRY